MPKVVSRRRKRSSLSLLRLQKWKYKFLAECRKRLLVHSLSELTTLPEEKRSKVRCAIKRVMEEYTDDMDIDKEEDIRDYDHEKSNVDREVPWTDVEDETFMKWVEEEMLNEMSSVPHLDFIDEEDEEISRLIDLERSRQVICPVCNEETMRCEDGHIYCPRDAYALKEHLHDFTPFKERIAQAHQEHYKSCCHDPIQFSIEAIEKRLCMVITGHNCRYERVIFEVTSVS